MVWLTAATCVMHTLFKASQDRLISMGQAVSSVPRVAHDLLIVHVAIAERNIMHLREKKTMFRNCI